MPRSKPSAADQGLLDRARAAGHPVSASQLERWRRRGLLPQPSRIYLGRHGSRSVYPAYAGDLVCALARHRAPGRRSDDLALLAFFDGAHVPELALKLAIARAYFAGRLRHEDAASRLAARVPDSWADELGAVYEAAEADAHLDIDKGGRAIRQMRINLRRLPELARASREELEERLVGVLVGLNLPQLPEEDTAFMTDLIAAVALDTTMDGDDALAVWEYAAISHAAQMAEYQETSLEERLDLLLKTSTEDLAALRDQTRAAVDEMWHRATSGQQTQADYSTPWMVRNAAAMLMEWMSARQVHPAGSAMAECHYINSLAHLHLRCTIFRAQSAAPRRNAVGEGRASFIARTTGAAP
ncbi:hypothetical protein ACIRO1_34880 [Streptomyces sp. NPDC102381]|uniref:hypothetical protein n=1 Tax=Streptomyces sp. NPDC102381 TaxID=3366164 RepID=UPI00381F95EB